MVIVGTDTYPPGVTELIELVLPDFGLGGRKGGFFFRSAFFFGPSMRFVCFAHLHCLKHDIIILRESLLR